MSELAVRGGKSTSHSSLDDEEDKESECVGKKLNVNSGSVGVLSVVGGHAGRTNNPLRDNLNSNFVGTSSHLALNYVPPLGPFCEYFGIPIRIYELSSILFRVYHFVYFVRCWLQIRIFEFV